jgi:hypothetical protein
MWTWGSAADVLEVNANSIFRIDHEDRGKYVSFVKSVMI